MAAKHLQKQRGRGAGRPFAKGVSGNPAGRPSGSRNQATEIAQALLDGEAEALARKCIELALEGDRAALKLCLERLVPRRPRAVALDLPAITSVADLAPAIAAIASGVAAGGLTPYDGAELARIFGAYAHAAEFGEFERRLRKVERDIETTDAPAD
jgi:Family of unknown function (DUF5681)